MPAFKRTPGGGKEPPIIIRKKRRGHTREPQHSSGWKIAYADFVTAMMAFFLLMWLINTMSNEQKKGISNYFDPIGVSDASSGAGGILGGQTIQSEGVLQDVTATPQAGPPLGSLGEVEEAAKQGKGAEAVSQAQEQQKFEDIQEKIREKMQESPELKELSENLVMDITEEGLRIQLIDRYKRPMFATASSLLYTNALKILQVVGQSILSLPNKIKLTGHTDAFRYSKRSSYSNWELSADRANSARRVLEEIIGPSRIFEVSGKAATEPLLVSSPNDPANRRISIVLLRNAVEGKKNQEKPVGKKETRKPILRQLAPGEAGAPYSTKPSSSGGVSEKNKRSGSLSSSPVQPDRTRLFQ